VIYAQYSFAIYPLATQAVGGRSLVIAAKDFGHDLDAMADAIEADTRLIFVANPNNPTGTFIPGPQIEAFLKRVPPNVVVVLDEAYTEFLAPELQYDSIGWVGQYPNLLVSRSMSKVYGLAGLRIGYGIAQPGITDLLNRIRQPFNVNSLAQAAAIAALDDKAFVEKSAEMNAAGYRQLTQAFDELKLTYVPSSANFVLVKVGDEDSAGAHVNLGLLKQGVIVRPVGNYGLPQWLRISIGLPEENTICIAALKKALA
jgi:histidinol-phosphate aminotransferase